MIPQARLTSDVKKKRRGGGYTPFTLVPIPTKGKREREKRKKKEPLSCSPKERGRRTTLSVAIN